ncbi:methyltransferase domain-containing protein [Microbispora sp. RL4-1S]|uniref:Methyltransferase domain-containing protein n=1 Tax=Microbispora oryzae TaxID=2806554 RepID=A0A940WNM8_9ACTN|nr:methyltransferase domain-containing protein [Microbispora oryzae]MBP2708233.1 methyltransferase domain-containing protein [Microbispora oryzae]
MIGELYAESLTGAAIEIEYADGTRVPLESSRWFEPLDGDEALLSRCAGPTLDVGSGPGRLTAALARRGVPALGIDITPHAVRLTRRAGGFALVRDVFGQVPGSGRWANVLLADGNIGIGGHPLALLRRVRQLARPGGEVLAEIDSPGVTSRVDRVRLRRAGTLGEWFGWARVSVSDIARLGTAAGFESVRHWQEGSRWFASLR